MAVQTLSLRPFRVLTVNVGLLRARVFGFTFFSNPPFADERLPFICQRFVLPDHFDHSLSYCAVSTDATLWLLGYRHPRSIVSAGDVFQLLGL